MSVSCTETGRRALRLTVLAVMMAAGTLVGSGPGVTCAQEPGPAADAASPPPGAPEAPTPAVTEMTLAPPVPDAAGVLTPAEGGLGPALWAGSPVELVRRLLAELPVAAPSPTQRRLTLRLLLSAAAPPAGDDTGNLLAPLRVAKLAALGASADLDRLLAQLPGGRTDPVLARTLAEAPAAGDPAGLAAVARSEAADPDQRVEAAEHAAAAAFVTSAMRCRAPSRSRTSSCTWVTVAASCSPSRSAAEVSTVPLCHSASGSEFSVSRSAVS